MPTPISQKMVKIRKPHRCWGCGKEFPVGTELECSTEVSEGHIMDTYWCKTCLAFAAAVDFWREIDDGIDIGDMKNDPDYEQFAKDFAEGRAGGDAKP